MHFVCFPMLPLPRTIKFKAKVCAIIATWSFMIKITNDNIKYLNSINSPKKSFSNKILLLFVDASFSTYLTEPIHTFHFHTLFEIISHFPSLFWLFLFRTHSRI